MIQRSHRLSQGPAPFASSQRPILAALIGAGIIAGCGGPSPSPSGNTSVEVLITSTANDQLLNYGVEFDSLMLTDAAGKSVTVFATPQAVEFIHVNGSAEPLVNATVPQDVYTSAAATANYAYFECSRWIRRATSSPIRSTLKNRPCP